MSENEETTNLFNRAAFLVDENIRGVQIGVYSVCCLGLAIALRSVRPFARFVKASDVPDSFIKSRTKLNGLVERIEPNGALLMVKHRPLIKLLPEKSDCLPVKVCGVEVSGNGVSWLQSVVAGNEVTFVPVLKENDCLKCQVTLAQTTNKNKIRIVDVGPALVSVGFGKITALEKALAQDPFYLHYFKQLKAAELSADKKREGVWYYIKSTQNASQNLISYIISKLRRRPKRVSVAAAQ